jgi:hypothetical protein
MTYEDAQPFVEKMYEIALWYHAKPNEFRKRAYETIETYGLTTNESANRQWTKMCEKLVAANQSKQEFGDTSAAYMVGVQDGKKQREGVQVSVKEFVRTVIYKEDMVGKPAIWAQWPTEENT